MAPAIDVHTHMLNNDYLALLEKHGGPKLTLKEVVGGMRAIHLRRRAVHDAGARDVRLRKRASR